MLIEILWWWLVISLIASAAGLWLLWKVRRRP